MTSWSQGLFAHDGPSRVGEFWISLIMHHHYSAVIYMIMYNSGIAVLDTARAFKYAGHKKMSNIVFILHTVLQLLYCMPFKIPQSPVEIMQNAQAGALLWMNVFWAHNALKVVKSIINDMSSGRKGYKDELLSSKFEDISIDLRSMWKILAISGSKILECLKQK